MLHTIYSNCSTVYFSSIVRCSPGGETRKGDCEKLKPRTGRNACWPVSLAPGNFILLQPSAREIAPQKRSDQRETQAPGSWLTDRNLLGDPVLAFSLARCARRIAWGVGETCQEETSTYSGSREMTTDAEKRIHISQGEDRIQKQTGLRHSI